jgi:hypothetical protein
MKPLTAVWRSRITRSALTLLGVAIVLVPLLAAVLGGRDVSAAQERPATEGRSGDHRPGFGRLAERCRNRAAFGVAMRHRVDAALGNLVDEGVLDEEQAAAVRDELLGGGAGADESIDTDAVVGATPAADAAPGRDRLERGGPCARLARFGAWLDDVATIVGLTPDEVLTRLAAGESLAEIAESEGISREELIAGLEAAILERLDRAVENGRLSEEERAEIEANLTERLETLVDHHRGDTNPTASDTTTPEAASA